MQLGTTTITFLPFVAVAGAAVLCVFVLWGVHRARRTPPPIAVSAGRPIAADQEFQPCDADWTGEAANGYSDPRVPVDRSSPAAPPAPARARTVADAVAERRVDTAPLPVVREHPTPSFAGPPSHAEPTPAYAVPVAAPGVTVTRVQHAAVPSQVEVAAPGYAPAQRVYGTPPVHDRAAGQADDTASEVLSAPADERPDTATFAALRPAVAAERPTSDDVAEDVAEPELPQAPSGAPGAAPVAPPWSAERREPTDTGPDLEPAAATDAVSDTELSGAVSASGDPDTDQAAATDVAVPVAATRADGVAVPMSRAVQQALAARAVQRARQQRDGGDQDESGHAVAESSDDGGREQPLTVLPSHRGTAARTGDADARDRLLAVLLADPARAVGATEDLEEARDRVEKLGEVLRRRRADLADAVRQLHESGLDRTQIGRLAGLADDDVRLILESRSDDGADDPRHL